jgi:hypothetical protein
MPQPVLEPCDCNDGSVWCNFLHAIDDPGRLSLRYFGLMGLRTFEGAPRPALDLWKSVRGSATR